MLVLVELPEFFTEPPAPPCPPAPPIAVETALPPLAVEDELELLFDLDWEDELLFELELFVFVMMLPAGGVVPGAPLRIHTIGRQRLRSLCLGTTGRLRHRTCPLFPWVRGRVPRESCCNSMPLLPDYRALPMPLRLRQLLPSFCPPWYLLESPRLTVRRFRAHGLSQGKKYYHGVVFAVKL